jgi:hypothetical protein
MQKSWIKYTLLFALTTVCGATVLSANDEEGLRPVGKRMASQVERAQSQEGRFLFSKAYPDALSDEEELAFFEEAQQLSEEEIYAKADEQASVKSCDGDDSSEFQAKSLSSTSHLGAYHNPRFVTPFGDAVALEDDSRWVIRGKDQSKTLNWYTNDRLVITPNHDWFSSYDYRINNLTTGHTVRCNLVEAPSYNGIYTHWIVAIDYSKKKICLEDGSLWSVSMWDGSELKRMALEDTIIIGTNDSWFKSSKPNVLINVDTMEFVKARCTN